MIPAHGPQRSSPWEVLVIFLRLGLTSFGGPIAHLGYFRDEFVTRRQWLSEQSYIDLVALCQFLPGPASSQVGMALGLTRAGYGGALAAWLGFTLPSALALTVLAGGLADALAPGALQGLKVVAVAVVAQAVWGMARSLCTDTLRISLMVLAACLALWVPTPGMQLAILAGAAALGLWRLQLPLAAVHEPMPSGVHPAAGLVWLALFLGLLLGLPLLALHVPNPSLALVDVFYRAGALVFGGGHVVLPLLQAQVVPNGWVSADAFLAGYGAAQAVPGPLFTFAAFLGASMNHAPSGGWGAGLALLAIFAPSFLLVAGALPFWEQLRRNAHARSALAGVNAAVVGLLLAALYQPLWTSAIRAPADFALALLAFVALLFWKLPPWLVVAGCATAGWGLALLGVTQF